MPETVKNQTTPTARPARRSRRRAALTTAALGAVLAATIPGVAAAAPVTALHALGGIPSSARISALTGLDDLASAAQAAGGDVRVEATLPAAVDLTGFAVPPGNQGQYGACGSFTTAYTIGGWLSNYTHHSGAPFDPMYVYNQLNGGSASRGTTFAGNFGILESQGDVEAAYWTHPFTDYRSKPNAAELANAGLHKLTAHTTLFSGPDQGATASTAIKTALANNQPVAIGLPVTAGFDSLNSSDSTLTLAEAGGALRGYHAVAALGYDATGIVIENSWGPNWANHGFATLAWDFVESKVTEAYAAGTFVTGQNTLTPVVTQLSNAAVNTAGGTTLTVTAARLASVDTTQAAAVTFVSVADPSVRVNATVTAKAATTLTVRTPALPADGDYRVVLTGTAGAGVPNGTADVVTALRPGAVGIVAGEVGRSDVATKVKLVGSGFGTTAAAFTANKITATVGGRAATVTWIDDAHIVVLVPAAAAGTTAPIVVSRNGVAAPSVSVRYLAPLPVVTALSPARASTEGGTTVTATVKNASTATGVSLVSVTDSTVTATAPLTGRTATTVTFTAPAAPSGAEGDFHVVVTGAGGSSVAAKTDVLGYRTPVTATATATPASAAGGTQVPLTGSGFGATATAFTAKKLTATVGGKTAPLRWVSDTTVVVTVGAGDPGTPAAIALVHDGVPGAPVTGVEYAAVISGNSAAAGPVAGWTTKLTGLGFTGSGSWQLLDGTGTSVASLPVVGSLTALNAATGGGVLIAGPTSVTVRLPAEAAGMYRLSFMPSNSAFPGADFGFTSKSVVVYSDLG